MRRLAGLRRLRGVPRGGCLSPAPNRHRRAPTPGSWWSSHLPVRTRTGPATSLSCVPRSKAAPRFGLKDRPSPRRGRGIIYAPTRRPVFVCTRGRGRMVLPISHTMCPRRGSKTGISAQKKLPARSGGSGRKASTPATYPPAMHSHPGQGSLAARPRPRGVLITACFGLFIMPACASTLAAPVTTPYKCTLRLSARAPSIARITNRAAITNVD